MASLEVVAATGRCYEVGPMGRRLYLCICTAALALYAGLGLAWSVANLNDVPHYGDTLEYLRFARASKPFRRPSIARRPHQSNGNG